MICIKCGHANADSKNYCEKCNARLFKMAASAPSATAIDVSEGKKYLTPQRSYPTEHLYNLTCRAYEYIHQEAPGEPLLEAWEVVRAKLDEFEHQSLPAIMEQLQAEKIDKPDSEYAPQAIYLLNKGVTLYREGAGLMDQFIASGDNATLVSAVTRMQEGNDNVGLAQELCTTNYRLIGQELERRAMAARAAAAGGGAAPGGASGAAAARVGSGPAPESETAVE